MHDNDNHNNHNSISLNRADSANSPDPTTPTFARSSDQSGPASSSRKNFIWTPEDTVRLVSLVHKSKPYQEALLPSRETESGSAPGSLKAKQLRKQSIYRELFKSIFPGTAIDTERIKTKLRWLLDRYAKERSKLGRTDAGTPLKDIDPNDAAFVPRSILAHRCPWFEAMHEMLADRVVAAPSSLARTPARRGIAHSDPREEDLQHHASHGRGLTDLDDAASDDESSITASLMLGSGTSPSTSAAVTPQQSPTPNLNKRKQGTADERDPYAYALYQSTVEKSRYRLDIEREKTKRYQMRIEAERQKRIDKQEAERQKRKDEQRAKAADNSAMLEVIRIVMAARSSAPVARLDTAANASCPAPAIPANSNTGNNSNDNSTT